VCCTKYTVSVLYIVSSEGVVQSIQCVCCKKYTVSVLCRAFSECVVQGTH
jgi:hypothetical protein